MGGALTKIIAAVLGKPRQSAKESALLKAIDEVGVSAENIAKDAEETRVWAQRQRDICSERRAAKKKAKDSTVIREEIAHG